MNWEIYNHKLKMIPEIQDFPSIYVKRLFLHFYTKEICEKIY